MANESRIIKAAKAKAKERIPSRLLDAELRRGFSKEKAEERLTSRLMRRTEQMLLQQRIVRPGKANLRNHIRSLGTPVDSLLVHRRW